MRREGEDLESKSNFAWPNFFQTGMEYKRDVVDLIGWFDNASTEGMLSKRLLNLRFVF